MVSLNNFCTYYLGFPLKIFKGFLFFVCIIILPTPVPSYVIWQKLRKVIHYWVSSPSPNKWPTQALCLPMTAYMGNNQLCIHGEKSAGSFLRATQVEPVLSNLLPGNYMTPQVKQAEFQLLWVLWVLWPPYFLLYDMIVRHCIYLMLVIGS